MTAPGGVNARVGGLLALGGFALALLIGGAVFWGAGTSIAGAVLAQGEIARGQQRFVVQHPTGGVISQVLVAEGDSVAAGQVIARLDVRKEQAELAALEEELFEMEVRGARLRAEFAGAESFLPRVGPGGSAARQAILADEVALFEASRARLAGEIGQLAQRGLENRMRIAGLDAQAEALAVQIALVQSSLETQEALVSRGLVARATLLNLQAEEAALEERMAGLAADRALATAQQAAVEENRISLLAAERERVMQVLGTLATDQRALRGRALHLRQIIGDAALLSPAAGVVHGLSITTPKAVLGPADVLATVVPPRTRPSVSVRLPVRDADLVEVGQSVVLRLSSLDQRSTPQLDGRVSRIAPEPTEDRRSAQTFFAVDVEIPQEALADLPAHTVLLPGMPVETFIRTSDQAPLVYLVKPLADYFARAFRDG